MAGPMGPARAWQPIRQGSPDDQQPWVALIWENFVEEEDLQSVTKSGEQRRQHEKRGLEVTNGEHTKLLLLS